MQIYMTYIKYIYTKLYGYIYLNQEIPDKGDRSVKPSNIKYDILCMELEKNETILFVIF